MRKMVLTGLMCGLVLVMAACSSSKPQATAKTTTTSVDPAVTAKACTAFKEFKDTVADVGFTPATFKAAADKLREVSTTISTATPVGLVANAKALATAINASADSLSSAGTRLQAQAAVGKLVFAPGAEPQGYITWWGANCK